VRLAGTFWRSAAIVQEPASTGDRHWRALIEWAQKKRVPYRRVTNFGTCHFEYKSGREGDICLVGFSARKPSLVLYLGEVLQDCSLMSRLGKYKMGKGCLYIKTLDDVDRKVLGKLIARTVDIARRCRP
jgi:hypothetical protein